MDEPRNGEARALNQEEDALYPRHRHCQQYQRGLSAPCPASVANVSQPAVLGRLRTTAPSPSPVIFLNPPKRSRAAAVSVHAALASTLAGGSTISLLISFFRPSK